MFGLYYLKSTSIYFEYPNLSQLTERGYHTKRVKMDKIGALNSLQFIGIKMNRALRKGIDEAEVRGLKVACLTVAKAVRGDSYAAQESYEMICLVRIILLTPQTPPKNDLRAILKDIKTLSIYINNDRNSPSDVPFIG
jgi:hypothetical protein